MRNYNVCRGRSDQQAEFRSSFARIHTHYLYNTYNKLGTRQSNIVKPRSHWRAGPFAARATFATRNHRIRLKRSSHRLSYQNEQFGAGISFKNKNASGASERQQGNFVLRSKQLNIVLRLKRVERETLRK